MGIPITPLGQWQHWLQRNGKHPNRALHAQRKDPLARWSQHGQRSAGLLEPNKQSAHVLKDIRQAFTEGDWQKAAQLTTQNFNSNVPYEATGEPQFRFGSFTTMGELTLETGISEQGISGYRRALSVDSAYASVSFTAADGTHYERHTFISYPANVMAIRLTANHPAKQTFTLRYAPNPVSEGSFKPDGKGGFATWRIWTTTKWNMSSECKH